MTSNDKAIRLIDAITSAGKQLDPPHRRVNAAFDGVYPAQNGLVAQLDRASDGVYPALIAPIAQLDRASDYEQEACSFVDK